MIGGVQFSPAMMAVMFFLVIRGLVSVSIRAM